MAGVIICYKMKNYFVRFCCLLAFLVLEGEIMTLQSQPNYRLGSYLVHRKVILKASVVKLNDDFFELKVLESYKQNISQNKKLKIRVAYNYRDGKKTLVKHYLELNKEYIFFIGKDQGFIQKLVFRESFSRFKVENDSIFIGSDYLQNLKGVNLDTLITKNTFEDPLMPFGYKMSTRDFAQMVIDINKSFYPTVTGKSKMRRGYENHGYIYQKPETVDAFTLAIIEELKRQWGL